jgi:predicted DNA-binding transcriptional regulator YafY
MTIATHIQIRLDRLVTAINGRQLVRFRYHKDTGEDSERICEVWAVGWSTEHLVCRCYQLTDSGKDAHTGEKWRLFRVDRMRDIRVLPQGFAAVRKEYRSPDAAMVGGVVASVKGV